MQTTRTRYFLNIPRAGVIVRIGQTRLNCIAGEFLDAQLVYLVDHLVEDDGARVAVPVLEDFLDGEVGVLVLRQLYYGGTDLVEEAGAEDGRAGLGYYLFYYA